MNVWDEVSLFYCTYVCAGSSNGNLNSALTDPLSGGQCLEGLKMAVSVIASQQSKLSPSRDPTLHHNIDCA